MITKKEFSNGFEYIEIKNDSASAKIALQGAHIFEYIPDGDKPILWVSKISDFEYNKAIRGGIPICWPWFSKHPTQERFPQHGFARTSMFELTQSIDVDSNTTQITLQLQNSTSTLEMFAYRFELEVKITLSEKLVIELVTKNLDTQPFKITQALHSYFDVSDISDVIIKGLDKKPYFDALTSKERVQEGDIIFREEVDRVYQDVDGTITLQDQHRVVDIKNEGSSSVIVWNPWIEKCSRMSGMKNDAYKTFVCIESANAMSDFRELQPQQTHILKATIH